MSADQVTTIPAMVQALYTRLAASEDERLDDVQILLGQPAHAHLEDDLIVVGWSTEQTITSTQTRVGLNAKRDREDYEVPCLLSAQDGDETDPQQTLARCGELIEALHTVIAEDRTFGGLVLHTGLARVSMDPIQTATGPACTAEVVLTVSGLTRK
jgi:hypothetical protein